MGSPEDNMIANKKKLKFLRMQELAKEQAAKE